MEVRIADPKGLGGNRLDPDMEASLNPPGEELVDLADMTVEGMRESLRTESIAVRQAVSPEPVARIEDLTIPGREAEIPVRVYAPEARGPLPLLVFAHGGGWVIGDIDHSDYVCRGLANRVPCAVVSVGYRLAPEHRFPAGLHDVVDAISWVEGHAGSLGGDGTRIAVGGESAGGNLVTAAALLLRDQGGTPLACQVLIYPVADISRTDRGSYARFADGYGLSRRAMEAFRDLYVMDEGETAHPYVSPLLAKDLAGLPATLVITAEFDPLRDEGEAYASRLAEAGVPARCTRYNGMLHGFVIPVGLVDEASLALDEAADALRQAFGPS